MTRAACPCCESPKASRQHYLCTTCWRLLTGPARRALCRRDAFATARLVELRRQLSAAVPLHQVVITP